MRLSLTTSAPVNVLRTCGRALKSLTVLFLLLCVIPLAAQVETASITGKVTDLLNDQPVDYATIYVKGSNTAVQSCTTGRYLATVPAGEDFILVFSPPAYRQPDAQVGV